VSHRAHIHICRVSKRAHISPSWLCAMYCNIQKYVTAYIAVRPTVSLSMRYRYCSVLQCSCCSVLHCFAVCCSVLTAYTPVRPTVCLSMRDRYCSVLQCSCCSVRVAVFCCVLQCVSVCWQPTYLWGPLFPYRCGSDTVACCSVRVAVFVLQYFAVCCSMFQCADSLHTCEAHCFLINAGAIL